MMPPVHQTLSSASDVSAIVGDRIYRHGRAPQTVDRPYVTWSLASGVPENELSDVPGIDRQTVQVDCWAPGDRDCVALAVAVRDAIEPHAHLIATPANEREQGTNLYRIGFQFDWFLPRL
jgi:hypothetical protein